MSAYYAAPVAEFLAESTTSIIGKLAEAVPQQGFAELRTSQISVWNPEIEALKVALRAVSSALDQALAWGVLLEFPVPRRGRRIDAVVVTDRNVLVLEFKTQQSDAEALRQVEGYACDLADFHKPSRNLELVPLLVSSGPSVTFLRPSATGVRAPRTTTPDGLGGAILDSYGESNSVQGFTLAEFDSGEYHPVPPIIDAAIEVFNSMSVREIAQAECGSQNLSTTVEALRDVVRSTVSAGRKAVCFITGVPGSGKTLAGLTIAHDEAIRAIAGSEAAFFSGNGPLVKVLRAALVRDRLEHIATGELPEQTATSVRRLVETKIQNIHMFARHHYDDLDARAPFERVIVFDEAQRAWNAERNFRKFKRNISEPEMILSVLDRHDWGVLIALIGGGQEIHEGEAGLGEWGRALEKKYLHWDVFAPRAAMEGSQATAFMKLVEAGSRIRVHEVPALQLDVSTRSFRSTAVNEWCNSLLAGEVDACRAVADDVPVWITRELDQVRAWLKEKGRGLYRSGLVASSGAVRLRSYGIETSTAFHRAYPYDHWFLDGPGDFRSSYQLEVAATEFEIQGLELDFVGLCWGGDLIWNSETGSWIPRALRSNRWAAMRRQSARQYLINSYRVLMTRARQGMVIWVPRGRPDDSTLPPSEHDTIADTLEAAGAKRLVA